MTMKTRSVYWRKALSLPFFAGILLTAQLASGVALYENEFAGDVPAPHSNKSGTLLSEKCVLNAANGNAWVSDLLIHQRPSGNLQWAVAPMTYMAWFKVPDTSKERSLFRIVVNGSMSFYVKQGKDGKVAAHKFGGEGRIVSPSMSFTPDVWAHVAVVFPPAVNSTARDLTISVYFNGVEATGLVWNDLGEPSGPALWIGDADVAVSQVLVDDTVMTAEQVRTIYRNFLDYTAEISVDTAWSGITWTGTGTPDWGTKQHNVQLTLENDVTVEVDNAAALKRIEIKGPGSMTFGGAAAFAADSAQLNTDMTIANPNAHFGSLMLEPGVTLASPFGTNNFSQMALCAGQTFRLVGAADLTSLTPFTGLLSGGWLALAQDVTAPAEELRAQADHALNVRIEAGVSATFSRLVMNGASGAASEVLIDGGSLTLTSTDKTYGDDDANGALFLGSWNTSPSALTVNSGQLIAEDGVVNMGRDTVGAAFTVGADVDPARAATAYVKLYGIGSAGSRNYANMARFQNGTVALGAGGIQIPAAMTQKYIELAGPVTLTAFANWTATASHEMSLRTTASGGNAPTLDAAGYTITNQASVSGTGGLILTSSQEGGRIVFGAENTYSGGTYIHDVDIVAEAAWPFGFGAVTVSNACLELHAVRPFHSLQVDGPAELLLTVDSTHLASETHMLLQNVTVGSAGSLSVTAKDAAGNRFETVLVDGELRLVVPDVALVWNGADGDGWLSTTKPWLLGGQATNFIAGTRVVFGADGTRAVAVSGSVTVSEMTVNASGYDFTGAGELNVTSYRQEQDVTMQTPLNAASLSLATNTTLTAGRISGTETRVTARYLKLVITDNNGGYYDDGVAIAELMLMCDGAAVAWPAGSEVSLFHGGVSSTHLNEQPRSLIDGLYGNSTAYTGLGNGRYRTNKLWIKNATRARMPTAEIYALITLPEDESVTFTGYRVCSVEVWERNATGWALYSSMDGEDWRLLDVQSGLTTEARRTNTWYGDADAAMPDVIPAEQRLPSAALRIEGDGDLSVATLVGSVVKSGHGRVTLSAANSADTSCLNVFEGVVAVGASGGMPKNLFIGQNAVVETDCRSDLDFTWLGGGGTLAAIINSESKFSLSGDFTGVFRMFGGTKGNRPKINLSTDANLCSTNFWIEVMNGAQLWASSSKTANIRLAGEPTQSPMEYYGGALRLQSNIGAVLSGQIEVMEDATVTGNGRTCTSSVTVAPSALTSPTLRIGVALTSNGSVDDNNTFTGPFRKRDDGLPLNVCVNAYTITFTGGADNDGGHLQVIQRESGRAAASAVLSGSNDVARLYEYGAVTVGGGNVSDKPESLVIASGATLAVTGAVTVADAASTLTVADGGTLAYATGACAGAFAVEAGATLRPLAFTTAPLTVATPVFPVSGTVALDIDPVLLDSAPRRCYIVKYASPSAAVPVEQLICDIPEPWKLSSDATGVYLSKPGMLFILQ